MFAKPLGLPQQGSFVVSPCAPIARGRALIPGGGEGAREERVDYGKAIGESRARPSARGAEESSAVYVAWAGNGVVRRGIRAATIARPARRGGERQQELFERAAP